SVERRGGKKGRTTGGPEHSKKKKKACSHLGHLTAREIGAAGKLGTLTAEWATPCDARLDARRRLSAAAQRSSQAHAAAATVPSTGYGVCWCMGGCGTRALCASSLPSRCWGRLMRSPWTITHSGRRIYVRCANHRSPQSFFFSSRRRHTRLVSDWSSDVCSSD